MRKTFCSCPVCKSGKCGVCNEMSPTTLQHKLIRSEADILDLNIVDWNRLNGYWNSPAGAIHTIASWFINTAHATRIEMDIRKAPIRSDFPGWEHVGDHERIGKLYWNWFHHNHKGILNFSDSPDFEGTLNFDDSFYRFWGDIGQVSPSALAHTQKQMDACDMWISILSETKQVLIEPFVNLLDLFHRDFVDVKEPGELEIVKAMPIQASLW